MAMNVEIKRNGVAIDDLKPVFDQLTKTGFVDKVLIQLESFRMMADKINQSEHVKATITIESEIDWNTALMWIKEWGNGDLQSTP